MGAAVLLLCGCWAAVGAGPAAAIDTLVVGEGIRLLGWRNIADWGAVERVTVTFDSLFKWDVRPGQNLAAGVLRRGGGVVATYQTVEEDSLVEVTGPLPGLENLVDGDADTAFDPDRSGETGVPRALWVTLDLGASFTVNRVRLFPRLDADHRLLFPQQFAVYTSESESSGGPFAIVSRLNFGPLLPNAEPLVDRFFPSRAARFIQLRTPAVNPWELAEVEVYGDGTAPVGQFQSIPLPARNSFPVWGRVRYEGGDITDLPVVFQTRSGPDRKPILYFRLTGVGDDVVEVPAGIWGALDDEEKGPVRPNPEWTNWTTLADGQIRSAELHRYIQFRIRFPEPGTILRRLIIEYAQPPLVERLRAELNPSRVPAGIERVFTLSALAHTITSRTRNRTTSVATGFRQLEVRTTAPVASVDQVLVDDVEVPFSARIRRGEGFTVNLGRRVEQDGTFLQIRFRAAVYHDATRFDLRAVERRFSGGRLESVYQAALAEDVDPATPGGQLVVRLEQPHDLVVLPAAAAVPPVLSPNGDGVNDRCEITFDLFKLTRPTPVTVEVFDLAGRRLRLLLDDDLGDGRHAVEWRGLDAGGRPVAPGSYLFRVRVRGDESRVSRQGVVGVVY